ncbi:MULTISPECIES: fimbria/pilus outer membrane usher protein [Rahnella]|uniref:fimbria/pilus outer membrane usher protein n=1 Tax=Rahnella TaxID=34037 RepID=UPI003F6DD0F9
MKIVPCCLILFPISAAHCSRAYGDDFDLSLMEKMDNLRGVDTSVLLKGSQMLAGDYPVALLINSEEFGQITQPFRLTQGSVQPVFTAVQLKARGIATDHAPAGLHPLAAFVDNASVTYDAGSEKLSLTVPQARLTPPSGDIAPQQEWNAGLNAARINYNLNLQRDTGGQSQNTHSVSSTFNNGLNLGNWRLRNDGYFRYQRGQSGHYQSSSSYLTRDIAALKSTFRGGDFFTNGKIFSSVSLRGITLYSSEEMRPDNQRFFMPAISGTARTNATVVIRQNGFVIDQRRVTPGAFAIRDVHSASSSGDLEISVNETDGSVQHFTQAFNAIAALLPPGVFSYELSAGRYRSSGAGALTPSLYQASAFYGLNNTFTLLAGQQMASRDAFRYQNSGGGLGANLPLLGGMSVLLKRSETSATTANDAARQGKQLETLFVRTLNQTQSTLSLSWKHKYSADYQEVSDAIGTAQHSGGSLAYHDQYNVQLDQSIESLTLLLRYTQDRTWNGEKQHSSRICLTMSRWQSQFQIYYTHQRDLHGSIDNSLTFNVQTPLGESQNHRAGFNSLTGSHGSSQQTASLNGSFLDDNQLSYDASISTQGADVSSNLSGTYSGSSGLVSAGLSQGKGYQQTLIGLQGGVLVHHHGITLSQPLGDTVVLVHTPQTRDLKIENNQNVYTDRWGNAVVPYAVPYRVNDVGLDPSSLNKQIDVPSAVERVVPTQGAIVEADFNARRHDRRFARISDSHRHPLPFGVSVQDASQSPMGTGGAAGVLLADFTHRRWPLTVSRNGHVLCHIAQPSASSAPSDTSTLWKLSCL